MTLVLAILSLVFSFTTWAQDISYTDASFKGAPLEHAHKLNEFFKDEGFIPLADSQFGIPSLGINQVYFADAGKFVMVKYGIEGEFPLKQIITTPEGYLVHDKIGDNKFFLYFRGINQEAVKLTLIRMQNKISQYTFPSIKSVFIPEARAQADCGSPALVQQMTDFANLSGTMVWNFAKNCVSGLGEGAWAASGGAIASGLSSLWEAVKHPIETVDKIGNAVERFTVGLANFTKGLVTDPRGTLTKMGAKVGGAWDEMVDVVTNMSTDMKIQFICSFIGSLGVDAAIAFFTAGVASGKIAISLGLMAKRFSAVAKTMGLISKLSIAARAQLGMTADKMKNFMDKLMHNKIPEGDLKHLDNLTTADKDFSVKVVACYM
ncbi:hypothetical protein ACJVC5_11400 [Peredibacter sp. HCB2-198]|uniref:hypothetical protein n=1 Tax=Peredibacter sp. HCB2-198 TaxID=3383025 RepID=UPI0038B53992